MADTDRSLAVATGQDELAHGSLRIWDAIAISVSVIAPGMAMLLNVSGVAIVAGGSTHWPSCLAASPAWRWRSW